MTRDSQESSPEKLEELYDSNQRAANAMLERIVLRSPDEHRRLDRIDDPLESAIRSAIWSTEEAITRLDPNGEHKPERPASLAETMVRSRLDDETVFHDVLPEDFDDFAFGRHLVERRDYYNNFPAIIAAKPSRPEPGENIVEFWSRTKLYQYATKPYLMRAHALQPEFMGAFQRTMEERYPMSECVDSLYRAVADEHPDPKDLIMLRASRLTYQFLINLMRKDDLQTQGRIMTTSLQQEITDPITELYT